MLITSISLSSPLLSLFGTGKSEERRPSMEEPPAKKTKTEEYFDPVSLVKAKEGTMKVPKPIQKYLEKHLKLHLSKKERKLYTGRILDQFRTYHYHPLWINTCQIFLARSFPRELRGYQTY